MNIGNGYGNLTIHELAQLADWADYKKNTTPNPEWKKAFALIREGADLLLRRMALCTEDEKGQDTASDVAEERSPMRPTPRVMRGTNSTGPGA